MNPHWFQTINRTLQQAKRVCPHCQRTGVYASKQPGQFYTCKHCGHRFKEKGSDAAATAKPAKRD